MLGFQSIQVECVAASVFTDLLLRQRLHAQLDTLDAETLLGSFRRVLRGAAFCRTFCRSSLLVTTSSFKLLVAMASNLISDGLHRA